MNSIKTIVVILSITILPIYSNAQEVSAKIKIQKQINNLRTAHLNSDANIVDKIYHPKLVLTSQSGKKYGKEMALANIKNKFESYESSDIQFLNISTDVILTNYINERKYKGFEKGRYRLTVIWKKFNGTWTVISMQSSKIKK